MAGFHHYSYVSEVCDGHLCTGDCDGCPHQADAEDAMYIAECGEGEENNN